MFTYCSNIKYNSIVPDPQGSLVVAHCSVVRHKAVRNTQVLPTLETTKGCLATFRLCAIDNTSPTDMAPHLVGKLVWHAATGHALLCGQQTWATTLGCVVVATKKRRSHTQDEVKVWHLLLSRPRLVVRAGDQEVEGVVLRDLHKVEKCLDVPLPGFPREQIVLAVLICQVHTSHVASVVTDSNWAWKRLALPPPIDLHSALNLCGILTVDGGDYEHLPLVLPYHSKQGSILEMNWTATVCPQSGRRLPHDWLGN